MRKAGPKHSSSPTRPDLGGEDHDEMTWHQGYSEGVLDLLIAGFANKLAILLILLLS